MKSVGQKTYSRHVHQNVMIMLVIVCIYVWVCVCVCVCCLGSIAAVLEHWQDKVGHGEAQAHRTAALQTALEGVGVSNRELAAPMHGSTGGSLRHSYPTASLAHSQNQLRRSWLSQGKHSPPYYLTYINPLLAISHYFVSWQYVVSCLRMTMARSDPQISLIALGFSLVEFGRISA